MNNELSTAIWQALVVGILLIVPFWKVHKRAGLWPPLSLIIFLPWIGLVLSPLILAFVPWPAAKARKEESKGV